MTKEDIVKDVLIAIDENKDADVLDVTGENDPDTLEMGEIIGSKIADGINTVYKIAPVELLVDAFEDATVADGEPLPEGCLRVVRAKADTWKKPAELITPESYKYAQQFSEFVGIRGNNSRPVVSISDIVEVFPSTSITLKYVPKVEMGGSYDIAPDVYRACIYKIASLTAASYSQGDLMQLFNSLCAEQLGMSSKG